MTITNKNWFEVDRNGLKQLLAARDKAFIVSELIANAWDEISVEYLLRSRDPSEAAPSSSSSMTPRTASATSPTRTQCTHPA